jgi:hypothetical protein
MAAISSRSSTPTAKQVAAAERIANFTAEQRRLKAVAADRRAAALAGDGMPRSFETKTERHTTVAAARRSQYLQ